MGGVGGGVGGWFWQEDWSYSTIVSVVGVVDDGGEWSSRRGFVRNAGILFINY